MNNNNEITVEDYKQLKNVIKSIYDIESIPKTPLIFHLIFRLFKLTALHQY